MWIYDQATGKVFVEFPGTCYSGSGKGKNNPELQHVQNIGPIPTGVYTVGAPVDTKTHGPYVLALLPHPKNEMHGRSGFLIHGDSIIAPGTASQGCISAPRNIREEMWKASDHVLRVI